MSAFCTVTLGSHEILLSQGSWVSVVIWSLLPAKGLLAGQGCRWWQRFFVHVGWLSQPQSTELSIGWIDVTGTPSVLFTWCVILWPKNLCWLYLGNSSYSSYRPFPELKKKIFILLKMITRSEQLWHDWRWPQGGNSFYTMADNTGYGLISTKNRKACPRTW